MREQKPAVIIFKIPPEEKQKIFVAAHKSCVSMAEFIRRAAVSAASKGMGNV